MPMCRGVMSPVLRTAQQQLIFLQLRCRTIAVRVSEQRGTAPTLRTDEIASSAKK